ncbi:hypothetical protein Pint_02658 [Pistacia integerrima]|uniref:Uncharacterized protein n=1 Tax=Pistacia integerrima TaxID=434235 RepID=A0ACC0ZLW4_9ROSI|nr:hypothetical protein Pint_02658 [Pistacia integerrima]
MVSLPSVPLTQPQPLHSSNSNWAIGGLILTAEYILVPLWYIVQTQIMEYPAELTVVFFYNLCVSFIPAIVGLIAERPGKDSLDHMHEQYCSHVGITTEGAGLRSNVQAPVYRYCSRYGCHVSRRHPLSCLIGATIISIGFYTVMWGKAKEEIGEDYEGCSLESPDAAQKVPLLQNNKNDLV